MGQNDEVQNGWYQGHFVYDQIDQTMIKDLLAMPGILMMFKSQKHPEFHCRPQERQVCLMQEGTG